jgi:hypothetical protein
MAIESDGQGRAGLRDGAVQLFEYGPCRESRSPSTEVATDSARRWLIWCLLYSSRRPMSKLLIAVVINESRHCRSAFGSSGFWIDF